MKYTAFDQTLLMGKTMTVGLSSSFPIRMIFLKSLFVKCQCLHLKLKYGAIRADTWLAKWNGATCVILRTRSEQMRNKGQLIPSVDTQKELQA